MSQQIEFHGRVVYAGLVRMTEDRATIQRAYQFWFKKLSARPFEVKEVVAYFERYLGLKTAEKKALFIAMQSANTKLFEQLKPVPAYVLGDDAVDIAPSEAPVIHYSAHHQVTVAIVQHMALQLKRADKSAFAELATIIADEGFGELQTDINRSLHDWAGNNLSSLTLPKNITVDDCQGLFHAFYLLSTELVGPIATDQFVDAAVRDARNLEQSADFDPRDLL